MGTAIFCADYHRDLLDQPSEVRSFAKVYPTYPVHDLKVTMVRILGPESVFREGEIGGNIVLELYPSGWKHKIAEAYEGKCLLQENGLVFSDPFDARILKDLVKDDDVQYHLDPDALHPRILCSMFGETGVTPEDNQVAFTPRGSEDLEPHVKLSQWLDAGFFGIFQWYLVMKIGKKAARDYLEALKQKIMPDARYAMFPRYVADSLELDGEMSGSEILRLDVFDSYGIPITKYRAKPTRGKVLLNEKPFDFDNLLDDGKVLWVSESHGDAQLFFDTTPSMQDGP